jgi:amino acid transporter
MVYSLARDGALPLSTWWYHMDQRVGGPVRSVWVAVVLSFIVATPGVSNTTVLSALFSLTATGLYSSYIIPIFLRVTVSRHTFQPKEFNLGVFSMPFGIVSVSWGTFMIIVLCLATDTPATTDNINYSPIALGIILVFAWTYWIFSARYIYICIYIYINIIYIFIYLHIHKYIYYIYYIYVYIYI